MSMGVMTFKVGGFICGPLCTKSIYIETEIKEKCSIHIKMTAFPKKVEGDRNELPLLEVTGFNHHTKKLCNFSIKILFSENERP